MLKCVDEDVDAGDAARSSNAAIVCATVAFALLFILQCLYSTTQKNQTAYAIPPVSLPPLSQRRQRLYVTHC